MRSGASVFFGMRFTGRSGEVGGQLPKTCVHVHISTTILCIYGCAKAAGVLLQYFQISVPASLHRQAQGGNKNSVLLRRQGYNACAVWAGRRISAKSCTNACPCARARVCVCACVGTGYVCLCVRVSVISQRCMVAHTLVMHPSRNMPHKTPWGNKRVNFQVCVFASRGPAACVDDTAASSRSLRSSSSKYRVIAGIETGK